MPRITVREFPFVDSTGAPAVLAQFSPKDIDALEVIVALTDVQGAPTNVDFRLLPTSSPGSSTQGSLLRRRSASSPSAGLVLPLSEKYSGVTTEQFRSINETLYVWHQISGGTAPTISGTVYIVCLEGTVKRR